MEQSVQVWSEKTKTIYNGVLLYSICNVLYAIFDPINSAINSVSSFSSAFGAPEVSGSGGLSIFCYILLAGVIVGYFLFLTGLSGFRPLLETEDAASIGKVRNGVILGLVATGVAFIPLMGWVSAILNIIAFILMLLGYSSLKNSATFPVKGKQGASKLFTAMILSLIGAVLGFIPLAGGFLEMVLDIIAFFMILSGWASIKNSTPVAPAAPVVE